MEREGCERIKIRTLSSRRKEKRGLAFSLFIGLQVECLQGGLRQPAFWEDIKFVLILSRLFPIWGIYRLRELRTQMLAKPAPDIVESTYIDYKLGVKSAEAVFFFGKSSINKEIF